MDPTIKSRVIFTTRTNNSFPFQARFSACIPDSSVSRALDWQRSGPGYGSWQGKTNGEVADANLTSFHKQFDVSTKNLYIIGYKLFLGI